MDSVTGNLVAVLATIVCLVYGYYKYAHGYWRRRNVPYIPGSFPFGSIASVILRRQGFASKICEFYEQVRQQGHNYAGMYFFSRKTLLVADPDLIKRILSTDFQYFPTRGIYYDEKNDPLSAHLVAISGEQWKILRQKITPTFSSGKLKMMFQTIRKCTEQLKETLESGDDVVEMKDLMSRYTTDVIGSCAFGIECNSLKNPKAEFREAGKRIFKQTPKVIVNRLISRSWPWIAKKLKIRIINQAVSDFFINVVTETVEYRTMNNVARKDFLQLLIDQMDTNDNSDLNRNGKTLTINEIAAQAFVFFLAGFETSASTINFVMYELAVHTDIQERVRNEVNEVVKRHNGEVTYDAIMEMHYLEKVVSETMRKYPIFTVLVRICTQDYQLPDDKLILQKGTAVVLPIYALHHDPDYYPEPDLFDPSRFDSDANKLDHTYLPFGSGPRNCIGSRFAMIQMKLSVASMLQQFEFTLNSKTNNPIELNLGTFALTPMEGTWLNVHKIHSK